MLTNDDDYYNILKNMLEQNDNQPQQDERLQQGLLGDTPQQPPQEQQAPQQPQLETNNSPQQALEAIKAQTDNASNQMAQQNTQSTQEAMQASQGLQAQRDSQMQATEQQASQQLKQQQEQQQKATAGLIKLATMIYGAGAGGEAADAGGVTDTAMEQTAGNSAFMSGGDLATGMEHLNNASGDWLTKAMNAGGTNTFDFTKGLNKRFL